MDIELICERGHKTILEIPEELSELKCKSCASKIFWASKAGGKPTKVKHTCTECGKKFTLGSGDSFVGIMDLTGEHECFCHDCAHYNCHSYPNCDLDPNGCMLRMGDDVEMYGHN